MDQLNHLGWVVHRAYEVGNVRFGVRTNSRACGRWLDRVFGDYRVDDSDVAPYYSLLVAEPADDQVGKRFHILYEESRALVRTHDLRLVGQALAGEFEHVAAYTRDDAPYVDAGVVALGDRVALVPPILPPYLATLGQRKLARSGLDIFLAPFVRVDPGSGRIVAVPPTIGVSPGDLDRLAAAAPSNGADIRRTVTDTMAVDVICFIGLNEEPVLPQTPARATHVLATRTVNLEHVGGEGLEAVAQLVSGADCYEISAATPKDALASLLSALER